jgi:hypothetical protein
MNMEKEPLGRIWAQKLLFWEREEAGVLGMVG